MNVTILPNSLFMNILKIIFISLSFITSNSLAQNTNCFSKHLKDAIIINKLRGKLYQSLHPKAKSVTRKIIRLERLLLPIAFIFDKASRKYQENKTGFMCDEFVEMDKIPNFKRYQKTIPISLDSKIEDKLNKSLLKMFIKNKEYEKIIQTTEQMMEELEQYPNHFCLYRHFLESIRRMAYLAPIHIDNAHRKSLKSPLKLIKKLMNLHIFGLSFAKTIDKKAIIVQNDGVAILCQDIPHISMIPE